jgi:eukaryotic-like serine/threonine-protein kinase
MPSPRAAPTARRTAFFVERYAVYDEFAAGGMATVHYARLIGAQGFRRTVAAKRLLPHLTRDRDFALMLVDEARLAARVRHPNVVSTLDVVQTEGELLLVMDYIHGESLAKLARAANARGERIPLSIALAVVIDALHGLHAAHEAKDERGVPLDLVHRDVSPQNVLVGLDGITRIADFGVAKAAGRAHTTRDGAVKGKLAYMAPEQLSAGTVSRRTDVFAASIVLWELLANERLFAGSNHAETVFKVMSAPIPPPSTRDAGLSPTLDAIVMRGLSREPAERFQTAREMALALENSAPSVRASEIAAWVERIAGERLAQRAEVLSAIEHEEDVDTDAPTKPLPTPSSGGEDDSFEREPLEGETGRRRREVLASRESAARESAARMPAASASALGGSGASAVRGVAEAASSERPPPLPGAAATSPVGGAGASSTATGLEARVRRSSRAPLVLVGLAALMAVAWLLSPRFEAPRAAPAPTVAPVAPLTPAAAPAGTGHTAASAPAALSVPSLSPPRAAPAAEHPLEPSSHATQGAAHEVPSPATPDARAAGDVPPRRAASAAGSPSGAPSLLGAGSAARAVPANDDPSEPASAVPAPSDKRRARPARKGAAPTCDPPYSIDASGRVLFKVECM